MSGANLALFVLLGQVAAADPAELVTRLGAPHYAEREDAAAALERLGRQAIPALRAARDARDPEIRSRAAALFSRIEGALLTQASMVALDFEDQPLPQVVKALSDQSGIKLGLVPENSPTWDARRITLHELTPVPFWKAIDRLCEAARIQYNQGLQGTLTGNREPVVSFHDGGPRQAGPTSDSGPFRISLISVHYQRDVNFNSPIVGFTRRGVVPPAPGQIRPGLNVPQAEGPAVSEQFYAQVQVAAEPRLAISVNGPLKLLEAVDDRGQSLLPPQGEGAITQRFSGYFGLSTAALQVQAPLRRPDLPGQAIRKLRGVLPILVATRKPDPLVVPLQGAAGKSFHNDEVNLIIRDIRVTPATNQTSIELVVRAMSAETAPVLGGRNGGEINTQRPDLHQQQIEVVDSQGRVIGWYHSMMFDAEGSRMTLTLNPHEPQATPAELRYYGLARAATEVGFEFNDFQMP